MKKLYILVGVDSETKKAYAINLKDQGVNVLDRDQFMEAHAEFKRKESGLPDNGNHRNLIRKHWATFASAWVDYVENMLAHHAATNTNDCAVMAGHLRAQDRSMAIKLATAHGYQPVIVFFGTPKTMNHRQFSQHKMLEVPINPDITVGA